MAKRVMKRQVFDYELVAQHLAKKVRSSQTVLLTEGYELELHTQTIRGSTLLALDMATPTSSKWPEELLNLEVLILMTAQDVQAVVEMAVRDWWKTIMQLKEELEKRFGDLAMGEPES